MIPQLLKFIVLIIKQRRLIIALAKREIASQYIGSLLGILWTFIQPAVMIFVFWFVFSVGFKTKPMNDVPFVVWLTAGMAPWFAFADIVTGSAGIVVANAHLIKKTVFHSQILPVVRLLSSFVTHAVFLSVLIGLICFQKLPFSLFYFQFLYYLLCMSIFVLGVGWAVSALHPFVRDVVPIVGIVIQVGFWSTPIFWDITIMPAIVQTCLKMNPMFYIVQGYRDSFIYFVPFWHHPLLTVYFWGVALLVFTGGAVIFRKLKPQFADVL
jgi:lipopolysaccharide transport system permease protein